MEPEGSSPYKQEPATCPYPEPDQSSLRSPPPTQPLENPFLEFVRYSHLNPDWLIASVLRIQYLFKKTVLFIIIISKYMEIPRVPNGLLTTLFMWHVQHSSDEKLPRNLVLLTVGSNQLLPVQFGHGKLPHLKYFYETPNKIIMYEAKKTSSQNLD
jgi:hypothetical protein